MLALLLLLYAVLPVGIIYLSGRSRLASRIGSVIIAYVLGLAISHSGLIPAPSQALQHALELASAHQTGGHEIDADAWTGSDALYMRIQKWQHLLTSFSIALALPLLLFSLNVKAWMKMAGKTFTSLILAIVSVLIVVITVFWIATPDETSWKIGGMLVGLYTGGTPNLASLKVMLGLDAESYLLIHTYDMVVSFFYLVFVMSIGKLIFRKILVSHANTGNAHNNGWMENGFSGMLKKANLKPLSLAFALAVAIVVTAGAITLLTPDTADPVVAILTITTLGILLSFNEKINNFPKTFELGMYFILMFSLVVASMVHINTLVNIDTRLMFMVATVVFGTLLFHVGWSKLFNVDADTVMITSTALICSPPFVPMVAEALKNKQVIVGGLTTGIIGYAAGNYLGYLVSLLLKAIV